MITLVTHPLLCHSLLCLPPPPPATPTQTSHTQGLSGQFPPCGGRGAVSVCADDMEFLDPEAFLNDTVLDYYIK